MKLPYPKHSIKIKNFKSLENVEIEIRPITLILGPNSSGKSSLLKAIKFLSSNLIPLNKVETKYNIDKFTELGSYEEIVTNNSENKEIQFEITFNNKMNEYIDEKYKVRLLEDDSDNKYYDTVGEEYDREKYKIDRNSDDFKIIIPQEPYVEITLSELIGTNNLNIEETPICDNLETDQNTIVNNNLYFNFPFKQYVPFRLIVNFSKNIDNYNLSNVIIKWQEFSIKYSIIKGVSRLKWEQKFISNRFTELFDLLGNNIFLDFTSHKNGRKLEQKLLGFIHDMEFKNNISWIRLSSNEKNDFYDTAYFFLLYVYAYCIPIMESFLKYSHLPTTRDIPLHKYYLNNKEFAPKDYYGILRELSSSSNNLRDERIKHFIIKYLKIFGLANDIYIKKLNDDAGGAYFKSFKNNSESNLAEASSGMIQLLPIIYTACKDSFVENNSLPGPQSSQSQIINVNASKDPLAIKTILIEQPELHLHPKLQSQLVELFIDEELFGNKYIIETHSEHLIRKIQVLIAQGKLDIDRVAIYYFDNKNGSTQIKEMKMDKRGLFIENWPDGFFDDSSNLTMELYEALRMQNREN